MGFITSLDNDVQTELSLQGQLSLQTDTRVEAALNQFFWPTPVITPLQRQEREAKQRKKQLEQEIKEREEQIATQKKRAKKRKEEDKKEKEKEDAVDTTA